jgi:hypothetical protein
MPKQWLVVMVASLMGCGAPLKESIVTYGDGERTFEG